MVANYLQGGAAVNVLARRVGAQVRVVDLGVVHPSRDWAKGETFLDRSVRRGTSNFLHGPAMTRSEAFQAFQAGLDLGEQWAGRQGFRVIVLGEMGIANSTTAAALISAITGARAESVVGRGTGVDDRAFDAKRRAIAMAVQQHNPNVSDDWDRFARLGGFEMIGLAGLAVGAARRRALVVLDGLISSAAGLIGVRVCPALGGSLLAAHLGPEPGHRVALEALGLRPLLDLDLRLGEGTGAALALPIIASAGDILREMATFQEAGVSDQLAK
ncbi:MAG: hypothetical protein NVSMB9_01740 [Isosphaeraceae bacterium]